jgi:hypothetical protein
MGATARTNNHSTSLGGAVTVLDAPGVTDAPVVSSVKLYWANDQFQALSLTHGRAGSGSTKEIALDNLRANLEAALEWQRKRPGDRSLIRQERRPWWLPISSVLGHILGWRWLPTIERVTVPPGPRS